MMEFNRPSIPSFALEIFASVGENFPRPLLEYWGRDVVLDPLKWFIAAQDKALQIGAKYICFAFNIDEVEEKIEEAEELFLKVQEAARLPLIIRGTGQKEFDSKLLPALVRLVKKPSIVAFAQDLNYKEIVDAVVKSPVSSSLRLVLRAPIDINLTKELNILSTDAGLLPENIIIDTDTGCVGMGLDYGYSIIERIKEAAKTDDTLNHPVIVFAGEESFKSKESKSDDFKDTRGSLETRSYSIESATASALWCAGADIIVCENPKTIEGFNLAFGLEAAERAGEKCRI